MTIISSQQYINIDIVSEKETELQAAGITTVTIPCSYVGEIDGTEYAMQNDKHHTLQAAKNLGLEIKYDITEDAEGLTGEDLLEARYMDGDWYNVETSNLEDCIIDTIW